MCVCVQCAGAAQRLSLDGQRHLVNVQKYQLSDMAAQPVCRTPPIVAELRRLDIVAISVCLSVCLSVCVTLNRRYSR